MDDGQKDARVFIPGLDLHRLFSTAVAPLFAEQFPGAAALVRIYNGGPLPTV